MLQTGEFLVLMETLRDQNLISTAGVPAGESLSHVGSGLLDTEIRLRSPLQEIEMALKSELTSQSTISKRLVEHVMSRQGAEE